MVFLHDRSLSNGWYPKRLQKKWNVKKEEAFKIFPTCKQLRNEEKGLWHVMNVFPNNIERSLHKANLLFDKIYVRNKTAKNKKIRSRIQVQFDHDFKEISSFYSNRKRLWDRTIVAERNYRALTRELNQSINIELTRLSEKRLPSKTNIRINR